MAISDGQQALSLNQVRLEARCVTASGFFLIGARSNDLPLRAVPQG